MKGSEKQHIDFKSEKMEQADYSKGMDLFSKIFDNAPIVMIVVNQEGKVENINHATSEALGKQKEDALGLLGGELLDALTR